MVVCNEWLRYHSIRIPGFDNLLLVDGCRDRPIHASEPKPPRGLIFVTGRHTLRAER